MTTPTVLTRNILRVYRSADPEHLAAGSAWYGEALLACRELAKPVGYTVEQAVVALAHLSPRVSWQANLRALGALLGGKDKPIGMLGRSWDTATRSLIADDPLESFSQGALKTRSFANAI